MPQIASVPLTTWDTTYRIPSHFEYNSRDKIADSTTSGVYVIPNTRYVLHDQPLVQSDTANDYSEGDSTVRTLLAVVLGVPEDELPKLKEYGARALTSLHSATDAKAMLGVTSEQSVKIAAVVSLGRALYQNVGNPLPVVRGIDDVTRLCQSMTTLEKEQLRVLVINSRYQVIYEETLFIGTDDQIGITPRDVFQPAAARQASAIILIHNHPSGDATPSQADRELTVRIREAGEVLGIALLDHVVITASRSVSCLEE